MPKRKARGAQSSEEPPAFDAKTFLESAKQKNIEIDPSPGEELEPVVQKIMATPPAVVQRFREAAGIK